MLSYLDLSTEDQTPDQAKLYETCLKGSREEIRKCCHQGNIATQYVKDGMSPIHVVGVAGRSDAEAIIGIMLENDFDVNVQTRSGEDTVLHLIAEHVDVKEAFPLVLKILEYGPDLHIRNRKLRTPYDIAVAKGEFELAAVLEGTMTASEARQYYQQKISALYGGKLVDAVLRSNENDIQDFIRLGADPNYVNEHKNGAIHYAITHCKVPPLKTLQLLIDGNADVNLLDDEGDTALNLVIKSSRLRETGDMYKCVELLVRHGALSTFKDLDGNDALALATKRQYDDIIQLLTSSRRQHIQAPPTPRTPEPMLGAPHSLITIPAEESDGEEQGPQTANEPQLSNTATGSQMPTSRTAAPSPQSSSNIPFGGDPSPRHPGRQSPEQTVAPPPMPPPAATTHQYPEITPRFLLPPDIDEESDEDPPAVLIPQEALIRAAREGTTEDVNDALFGLRADPNHPDDTGLYPIHHVLIRGEFDNEEDRMDMLRALIEAGADINVQSVNSESTALHVAATKNQDHAAKLLLDTHKCDYNLHNKHGKTAYDVAEDEECQEVMDVIDAHREKVRAKLKKAGKAATCIIL